MENILANIQNQEEILSIKPENSWGNESNLRSNLNESILYEENCISDGRNAMSTQEDVLLVNIEIGCKRVDNVPIKYDCLLQDVAEELAENETVKVVYYLNEKIKKGGSSCDASQAQVLVKLQPNWKWFCLEDIVDDPTMTVEEAFVNIPDYLNLVFSLVPRKNSLSVASVAPKENPATHSGIQLISQLKELLAEHNDLLKKDSLLEEELLSEATSEKSHQLSKDKIKALTKSLSGLNDILRSPKPSKLTCTPGSGHHSKIPAQPNNHQCASFSRANSSTEQQQSCSDEYHETNDSSQEMSQDESSTARLSRLRTLFDPVVEVPRLQDWFKKDTTPNKRKINYFVHELNATEIRRGKLPVTDRAVYIWFKNTRARKYKKKQNN